MRRVASSTAFQGKHIFYGKRHALREHMFLEGLQTAPTRSSTRLEPGKYPTVNQISWCKAYERLSRPEDMGTV